MTTKALLVTMQAKEGKEAQVEELLRSALPLVQDELGTAAWFAVRLTPEMYGIFDAFADDAGRSAHLSGKVADALFSAAEELFSAPPEMQRLDVLADKLPGQGTASE